jgi:hypothetical protein
VVAQAELGQVVSVTAPAGEEREHLVIDSGAIIAGVSLAGIAKVQVVLQASALARWAFTGCALR